MKREIRYPAIGNYFNQLALFRVRVPIDSEARDLIERIGHFCFFSYNLNPSLNPLSALRGSFNLLEWKLIWCENGYSDFLEQISDAVLVWSMGGSYYVKAVFKLSDHRKQTWVKVFWSDDETDCGDGHTYVDRIRDLRASGFQVLGALEEAEGESLRLSRLD